MRDSGRDTYDEPGVPGPASQRHAAVTPGPGEHHREIARFPGRELDLYGRQLARCLQALGTNAPIRADVQRELATVRAEQDSRATASEPGRLPDVSRRTSGALERTRRELQASLALARPDSPTRRPILAHLTAIDTELAQRTAGPP